MHRADEGVAATANHAHPQARARRPVRCCVDHVSSSTYHFVILGRSKERSDAAQTPGSMPWLQGVATVQNLLIPPRSSATVTAWIPWAAEQLQGSPRRSFAPASP
ncbi:MAG: hypothetical protein E5W65_24700 [Mesorhizobium sp.]|nr:MAG: hypothetical protein E5W65_24700 [Mesorhizobium sp.]